MKLFDRLFKSNKQASTELTTITRTEVIEGFSLPGIIHNFQYHFTDLQVYGDGLISCWEMVDLRMFKEKLNKGWVVPSIPNGEALSIFNLGLWMIEQGEWLHTKETLYKYVYTLVKQLNPTLQNLYDYKGSNTKKVGKTNVAKHFLPDPKPYYFDNSGSFLSKRISGEKFHIFFRDNDAKTYLAELSLYKDGRVEITNLPAKRIFEFQGLNELMKQGTITTEVKVGETVTIVNLGSFKIKSGSGVEPRLKLNEFTDKLNELNGRENSIAKCARIFEEYKQKPTKKLKEELKEAYEAIPEHRRIFVGNMDTKDYEVRLILYGEAVRKEWEEDYGYEYPYDDPPKPIDE